MCEGVDTVDKIVADRLFRNEREEGQRQDRAAAEHDDDSAHPAVATKIGRTGRRRIATPRSIVTATGTNVSGPRRIESRNSVRL